MNRGDIYADVVGDDDDEAVKHACLMYLKYSVIKVECALGFAMLQETFALKQFDVCGVGYWK